MCWDDIGWDGRGRGSMMVAGIEDERFEVESKK